MGCEILVAGSALIGLPAGSCINFVSRHLCRSQTQTTGSSCPACGDAGRVWLAILPFKWRSPCPACDSAPSWRRPAIEVVTALVFAAIAARHGAQLMVPLWCAFAALLIACAATDLEHGIVPDELSLGGLGVALPLVPACVSLGGGSFSGTFASALVGALLGGGSLWLLGFVHARASVAFGRHFEHWPGPGEALPSPSSVDYWTWFPGIGFGDVKLMALVGATLGPLGVLDTIAAATVIGLAQGLVAALGSRRWSAPFRFAPAIAVGALTVVLVPGNLLRL